MSDSLIVDSVLLGADDDPVLHRIATVAVAAHAFSKRWMPWTTTVAEMMIHLAEHPVAETKEGRIVCFGSLDGRRRMADRMTAIEWAVYEVDEGQSVEDGIDIFQSIGCTGVFWTTFSCRVGVPKFRMALALAEPWQIDPDEPLELRKARWKANYDAFGHKHGIAFDPTGSDLNRGHYSPRHAEGAPFFSAVQIGPGLVLPRVDVPAIRRAATRVKIGGSVEVDPILRRAFGRLLSNHGDEFDICGYLEALGWPIVRWHGHDKATIECPNRREHSNPDDDDDPGCAAFNAGDRFDSASITCRHAHCQEIRASEFLAMIVGALELDDDPLELAETFVAEEMMT